MRRQKEDVVHCEIELVTHPGVSGRYLVNVRQGHINAQWRETTVTPQPVLLADAQALFQQTLAERLAQGFVTWTRLTLPHRSSTFPSSAR